jgi:glycosyltransferase involved in cell wall biosynthesis
MIKRLLTFFIKEKSILPDRDLSASTPSQQLALRNRTIVMIAPTPFYSGRGTHLRILHEAKALAEKGYSIIIATYHIGDTPPGLHPGITIKRINRFFWWYTKRSSGPDWQKLCLDLLLCIKVLRICKRIKPEILHGHLHEGVLIGWVVKRLLFYQKMVLIGDFHGTLVNEMKTHGYLRFSVIQKLFTCIEKLILRIPCMAFVSSPSLKHVVEIDCKASDVYVLSDAPTLSSQSKQKVSPTFFFKTYLPCVVYTGGFTPDKGLESLFQVIAYTLQNGLSCQWILAGSPIKLLSIPADIQKAVTVISPLDHNKLGELLKHADVACEPKQSEVLQGSGKLLNYMYGGVPPICFDGPAQRFYLGEELAPRLIAKDIPHFYHILKSLLEMPTDEKDNLKNMILQRIKLFSWSKSADTLEYHYIEQWKKMQE